MLLRIGYGRASGGYRYEGLGAAIRGACAVLQGSGSPPTPWLCSTEGVQGGVNGWFFVERYHSVFFFKRPIAFLRTLCVTTR
jgi:hypothetical protein